MVHSKLISEGKVEPLTFSQLRKLEKIDAKKERDAKLLELSKEAIVAGGQIGRGIMQGTVTGPIALTLILSATYKGWTPIVAEAFSALAGAIADAWRFGPGKNIPLPPSPNLAVPPKIPGDAQPKSATVKYCIKVWHGALTGGWVESCWADEGERNGAFAIAAAAGNSVILEDPVTTG